MKYLITENRLAKVIEKGLTKEFGKLIKMECEFFPNSIFWINPAGKIIVWGMTDFGEELYVYKGILRFLEIFNLEKNKIRHIVTNWIENHLGFKTEVPDSLNFSEMNEDIFRKDKHGWYCVDTEGDDED